MRKIIFLLLICFAVIGWRNDGNWDQGSYYTRSISFPAERAATSDTLNAGERGKTISVDCTSQCEFDLPAASVGTSFTFVSEAAEVFFIDPVDTDTIQWDVAGTAFSPGDKLESPGATNDLISVISTRTGYWTVQNVSGSWTNGG